MTKSLFVNPSKSLHGGIGIRGGLKVGEKMVAAISALQAENSVINLMTYFFQSRNSTTGTEASIVAKFATSQSHRAVHVGTGEPRINAHLLHSVAEQGSQKEIVLKVAEPGGAPIRAADSATVDRMGWRS